MQVDLRFFIGTRDYGVRHFAASGQVNLRHGMRVGLQATTRINRTISRIHGTSTITRT